MNYLDMHLDGYPIGSGMVEKVAKEYMSRFCGRVCVRAVLASNAFALSVLRSSASVLIKCGLGLQFTPKLKYTQKHKLIEVRVLIMYNMGEINNRF
jgi:hypothetical protein